MQAQNRRLLVTTLDASDIDWLAFEDNTPQQAWADIPRVRVAVEGEPQPVEEEPLSDSESESEEDPSQEWRPQQEGDSTRRALRPVANTLGEKRKLVPSGAMQMTKIFKMGKDKVAAENDEPVDLRRNLAMEF
eukprot:7553052-Pyramimonas_sp.AAC.1